MIVSRPITMKYKRYCDWINEYMPNVMTEEIVALFKTHGEDNIRKVLERIGGKYDRVIMDDLQLAWDLLGTDELNDLVGARDEDFPAFTLRQTRMAMSMHPPSAYKCCKGCQSGWCRCCAGVCHHDCF